MRKLMLVLGSGAMLAGAIPAEAKDRDERRAEKREDRRHHRRDRDGNRDRGSDAAGGFVLGALAVGLIAALSSKKPPVAPETIAADTGFAPPPAAETDADAAVSACVGAVEGEGRRTFALAQAGQVRSSAPFEEGYAVEGDVLLRAGWRDAGERRGFRCTVDAQAVRTVAIEGLVMLPPRP